MLAVVVRFRALRVGELDAALTHDYDIVPVAEHPALQSTTILIESMYLASSRPPDDADDPVGSFRTDEWIMGSPGTLCRLATERICQQAGFQPRVRHQIDDFGTVLALVAAGQGAAVIPRLGTAVAPPGVVFTRLPVIRRTHLSHRRGSHDHPAVAAFHRAVAAAVTR